MGTSTYANCTDCCGPPDCTCSPPTTLYLDLASACSSWTSTVTLTKDYVTAGKWDASAGLPTVLISSTLYCSGGLWYLELSAVNALCTTITVNPTTGGCSPFALNFDTINLSADCCGGGSSGTLTASVSE